MRSIPFVFPLILLSLPLAGARTLAAQGFDTQTPVVDVRDGQSEYATGSYVPPADYEPNVRAIIHQNAQTRGQQRQLRLSSMAWYGMSNSRPTASPTPFTTLYSPVWQMPGGRPYAWYPMHRTTYLIYR
jgi:hypothetical protein